MKKILVTITALVLAFSLGACRQTQQAQGESDVSSVDFESTVVPAPIEINKTTENTTTGKNVLLSVNNTEANITWSSSDPYIAKVNETGMVTGGHKGGTAVITAKVNEQSYSCEVTNTVNMRDISSSDLVAEIKIGTNFASAFDRIDWNFKIGYDPYTTRVKGMDKITYYQKVVSDTVPPKPEMIDVLKEAGYNAIRLNISYSLYANDKTFEIDKAWLDVIEQYVNIIEDKGMYCIINSHYDYLGRSWVGDKWSDAWMMPEYSDYVNARFAAIWQQVAERFKDYDDYLLFESMNEPSIPWEAYAEVKGEKGYDEFLSNRVNELNSIFVKAVRNSGGNNSGRHLLLACPMEHSSYLKGLILPDDKRLIATVHCYYQLNENNGKFFWSHDKKKNTQPIIDDFAAIKKFMDETGIPVIIGEWGSQEGLPVSDRIDQATYFIKKATELGIPCFWWDAGWYDFETPSERIGLYDRTRMQWVWPEIMEATMKVVYGE